MSNIVQKGYLRKSPPLKQTNSRWFERYFTLYERNPRLYYYKDDTRTKEKGSIDLRGINEILPNSKHASSKGYEHGFELVSAERRWVLIADTEDDMKKWISSLQRNHDKRTPIVDSPSTSKSSTSKPSPSKSSPSRKQSVVSTLKRFVKDKKSNDELKRDSSYFSLDDSSIKEEESLYQPEMDDIDVKNFEIVQTLSISSNLSGDSALNGSRVRLTDNLPKCSLPDTATPEEYKEWIMENNTGMPQPRIVPVPLNGDLPSTLFLTSNKASTSNSITLGEVDISKKTETSFESAPNNGAVEAGTPEDEYDVPTTRPVFGKGEVATDGSVDPFYDTPKDRTTTFDSESSVDTTERSKSASSDIYDTPRSVVNTPTQVVDQTYDTPKPILEEQGPLRNTPKPKRQVPPLPTSPTARSPTPPLPQRKTLPTSSFESSKAMTLPPPRREVPQVAATAATPPLPPRIQKAATLKPSRPVPTAPSEITPQLPPRSNMRTNNMVDVRPSPNRAPSGNSLTRAKRNSHQPGVSLRYHGKNPENIYVAQRVSSPPNIVTNPFLPGFDADSTLSTGSSDTKLKLNLSANARAEFDAIKDSPEEATPPSTAGTSVTPNTLNPKYPTIRNTSGAGMVKIMQGYQNVNEVRGALSRPGQKTTGDTHKKLSKRQKPVPTQDYLPMQTHEKRGGLGLPKGYEPMMTHAERLQLYQNRDMSLSLQGSRTMSNTSIPESPMYVSAETDFHTSPEFVRMREIDATLAGGTVQPDDYLMVDADPEYLSMLSLQNSDNTNNGGAPPDDNYLAMGSTNLKPSDGYLTMKGAASIDDLSFD